MQSRKYDLEERLITFACRMIDVVAALPKSSVNEYLAAQLIRSSHSSAFNYGEAQGAESAKDFIHKLGIVLKEFKECRVGLKIILRKQLIQPIIRLEALTNELEELIAIIAKSITTTKNNLYKIDGSANITKRGLK